MLIPQQGVADIWGPSCEAAARLAAAEVNAAAGILGQQVELLTIDAGQSRAVVAQALRRMIRDERIEALVAMHLSDLRGFVASIIPSELPYVYTPLYEGGEANANVFAIGETPDRLLRPGIEWLADHRRVERWYLVGNDYIWPQAMHGRARRLLRDLGANVVGSSLLPFAMADYAPILDRIRAERPDAILMSLVGEDAVSFNRAFAESRLSRGILRFSTAIEENVLYGIGPDNTENMHLSGGYFSHLRSAENDAFRDDYHAAYGEAPPVQNEIGQSCYEGMHYLAALMNHAGSPAASAMRRATSTMEPFHRSARFSGLGTDRSRKVHVATADGIDLRIVHSR